MSLNQCTFIGRLTRSASDEGVVTVRNISGKETKMFKSSIAVEREYKNSEGKYPTDFINFTAWRGQADFLEKYAGKGKLVMITGRLQINEWKPEGADYTRRDAFIDATSVQLLEWGDRSNPAAAGNTDGDFQDGGVVPF